MGQRSPDHRIVPIGGGQAYHANISPKEAVCVITGDGVRPLIAQVLKERQRRQLLFEGDLRGCAFRFIQK